MPRRDGTLTAEEIAARQQAGKGAPPPPPEQSPSPAAAVAAALALTAGVGAPTTAATAPVAGAVAAAATTAAAAGILAAFDRFLAERRAAQAEKFAEALRRDRPDIAERARHDLAGEEMRREREFAAKQRVRLDRDVRAALALADPQRRRAEIDRILKREQTYVELREQAIEERARGSAAAAGLEEASPGGAFWRLSPRMEHCRECLRMAGKAWPWSVLRQRFPPRHLNCGCKLYTLDTAIRMGWLGRDDIPTPDQAVFELALVEAAWNDETLILEYDLMRARFDTDAAEAEVPAAEPQAPPDVPAPPPIERLRVLGDELAVRTLLTASLTAGDRILVDGDLDRVEAVERLGVVRLGGGPVLIHRETVRGVPGPDHAGFGSPLTTFPDAVAAAEDMAVARWSLERRKAVIFGGLAQRLVAEIDAPVGDIVRGYIGLNVPGRYTAASAELVWRIVEASRRLGLPLREVSGAGA